MTTKGTPSNRFPYRVPRKILKKSYALRMEAAAGNERAKRRLVEYNRQMKDRKMRIGEEEWVVSNRSFTRYQMMDYITVRTANGETLTQICDEAGMPSMLIVYEWFESHPDFEKAMVKAEKVRGHRLGDEAEKIARNTDRENATADKLKIETFSKAAARLNEKFQDKIVQKVEDEYSKMNPDQIRERIRRMLEADPSLAALVPHELRPAVGEIDVQPESSETQSLSLAETETPDEAES